MADEKDREQSTMTLTVKFKNADAHAFVGVFIGDHRTPFLLSSIHGVADHEELPRDRKDRILAAAFAFAWECLYTETLPALEILDDSEDDGCECCGCCAVDTCDDAVCTCDDSPPSAPPLSN